MYTNSELLQFCAYLKRSREDTRIDGKRLSVEKAAELVFCSTRILFDYEKDKLAPSDVICNMATVYNKPEILTIYSYMFHPVSKALGLITTKKNLRNAVGQLIFLNEEIVSNRNRLSEIAEDNLITDDEKPDTTEITAILLQMKKSIDEYLINVYTEIPVRKMIDEHNEREKTTATTVAFG